MKNVNRYYAISCKDIIYTYIYHITHVNTYYILLTHIVLLQLVFAISEKRVFYLIYDCSYTPYYPNPLHIVIIFNTLV